MKNFEIARVVGYVSDIRQLEKVPIRHRRQSIGLRLESSDWLVAPEEAFGSSLPDFGSEYQVCLDELIAASPLVWRGTAVRRVSPPLPPLDGDRKPALIDASCLARQGERRDDRGCPCGWVLGAPLLFAVGQMLDYAGWRPINIADANIFNVFRQAGDKISLRALERVRWNGLASRGESARWAWREIAYSRIAPGVPHEAAGRDVADRALLRAAIGEFPSAPIITLDRFRGLAAREGDFRWTQEPDGQSRMAPIEIFGSFFSIPRLGIQGTIARELFA